MLNYLIIHELEKEAHASEAGVFLTDELIAAGEAGIDLVRRLHHSFSQKEDVLHGYLSPPDEALFPAFLRVLADEGFTPAAFLQFTKDAANALRMTLQGVIGAKGGYLVFAHYQPGDEPLIGIFLVRDTEGLVFRKDPERSAFAVDVTTYLNTERMAMACRIHLDRYLSGKERCVELIKHARSQKEISEYFINWIGLEQPESRRDLTATFLQVVEELPLPVDRDTGEVMTEDRFRSEVFNFAMNSPQRTIHIPAFDEHFYGEEPRARQYLQEHEVPLDPAFRFDRGLMKQLHHFRATAEGLSLSFTRDDYRLGKISLEGDEVVIHSPELASQIREMLGK